MKRFSVNLYFHGCYGVDVEAENERDALAKAEDLAGALDDKEFISAIDLILETHDVNEIK